MVNVPPKSFEEWERSVAEPIRADPLWQSVLYRKALFAYELAWFDCARLMRDERGHALVRQLLSSVASISANIEEGYGKGFGADYARYLQIALGSAREARGWYWRSRHVLTSEIVSHRLALLSELIAILTRTIPQQRQIKRNKS